MERIGNEIEKELARGGGRDAIPLAALTSAWPTVVGDAIARQAWPLRIARDGTLHVATSSATWAHELAFLGDEIIERLHAQLGLDAPKRMRCAVGPIPEAEALEVSPVEPAPGIGDVPPEVRCEAASVASAIADPELRELVARAARASLLRACSGRHF